MSTHESYVSLETAKLLKKAGFDWECREYYYNFTTTGWSLSFDDDFVNWNSWDEQYISAPTLDVAQRWLREEKNHHVCVSFVFANNHKYYAFVSRPSDRGHLECECGWIENEFNTYEEAQEAGIKKVLEIILEKGGEQ